MSRQKELNLIDKYFSIISVAKLTVFKAIAFCNSEMDRAFAEWLLS